MLSHGFQRTKSKICPVLWSDGSLDWRSSQQLLACLAENGSVGSGSFQMQFLFVTNCCRHHKSWAQGWSFPDARIKQFNDSLFSSFFNAATCYPPLYYQKGPHTGKKLTSLMGLDLLKGFINDMWQCLTARLKSISIATFCKNLQDKSRQISH